jgi:hypothetical protein
MPIVTPLRRILPAVLAVLAFAAPRVQAQCLPASCTGTAVLINFESLAPGAPVEGLGAVHPQLNITGVPWTFGPSCAAGSSAVIAEGSAVPFASYGTAAGDNGCLTGVQGFGHPAGCVLDYDFTFASGATVSCFSFRMLDYGDFQPFGGTVHTVTVTAYDAASSVVDTDVLVMGGGADLTTGDACTAGPNGDPGNKLFTVTGAAIVKVTLRFDAFPDPNVGFDDMSFCLHLDPTPTGRRSWGRIKTLYRG